MAAWIEAALVSSAYLIDVQLSSKVCGRAQEK